VGGGGGIKVGENFKNTFNFKFFKKKCYYLFFFHFSHHVSLKRLHLKAKKE